MRRLLTILALVAILIVSSAGAALAAGVFFASPPTPAAGSTVKGGQSIEVTADPPSVLGLGLVGPTVKSITVTIKPRPGSKYGTPMSSTQDGRIFKMQWDTNKSTPLNGAYDIEAVATLSDGKTLSGKVDNVKVENPASAPSDVKAGLEGTSAVVRWSANPEEDITSYKVSRSVEGGSFTHLASVDSGRGTSFTDSQAPVGKPLKYQVAAIRRNAAGDGGLESDGTTSSEFTIPAPPPPAVAPDGQPAPTTVDAQGNPVVTQTLPMAPAAAPFMAPTLPKAKAAPPPIYKSRPSEISFAETLPFGEAPPPQKFEDSEASDLAAPSGLAETLTSGNPLKYIGIGVVLLGMSFMLFRQSRKILTTGEVTLFADEFDTGVDFSSLGDIELPPIEVDYPTFRVADQPFQVAPPKQAAPQPLEPAPLAPTQGAPDKPAAMPARPEMPALDMSYPAFKVGNTDPGAQVPARAAAGG